MNRGVWAIKIFHEIRKYKDDFPLWTATYENMSYLAHRHSEIELMLVLEGITHVTVDGEEYIARKGDLLICGSQSIHFNRANEDPNKLAFILFDSDLVKDETTTWHENHFFCADTLRTLGIENAVHELFETIAKEMAQRRPYYQKIVTAEITRFWYAVRRAAPPKEQKTVTRYGIEKLEKSIRFIKEHYKEPLTLKTVADTAGFSPCYYSSLFRHFMGVGFNRYLQILRVNAAALILKNENVRVLDAALDSGFANLRTFNRVFKLITGQTPGDFISSREEKTFGIIPLDEEDVLPVENDSLVVKLKRTQ